MASLAVTTISPVVEWKHGVKFISITFLSDTAVGGDGTLFTDATVRGQEGLQLHSVSINGGSTGPTANSDIEITDTVSGVKLIDKTSNGLDVVDGDDSTTYALAENTTHVIHGPLTVAITGNIVNAATTVVNLTFIPII